MSRPVALLPWLPLALLLGCTPVLNPGGGEPPDDDDAADDDDVSDDDDFIDDDDDDDWDDDDSWDDDDDDDDDVWPTEGCEDIGEGSVGADVWGAPEEGAWIEGELGWDGENLFVDPEFGPAFAIRVWYSADIEIEALMEGIEGPGMLYWATTGSGGWEAFGVVAAVTDAGDVVALGYGGGPPESFDGIGFSLRVEPEFGLCPEPLVEVSDCGIGTALPLIVSWIGGDTGMEGEVWPGMSIELGDDLQFTQYSGYQLYEAWCDDFPDWTYSWSMHR